MNKTKVLISMLAGLVVLVIFLIPSDQRPTEQSVQPQSAENADKPKITNTEESLLPNLVIGDPSAPVSIVEYGDYKCPSCNKFHHSTLLDITQEYINTNKVNIVYRNLPYIAEDSRTTAHGAYCANEQNIFTSYHNGIFEHLWNNYYATGNTSAEFDIIFTAENIIDLTGIKPKNTEAFVECVNSKKYQHAIDRDLKESELANAYGTPTFTIADQKITGPQPFTVFKTLIDIQLQ